VVIGTTRPRLNGTEPAAARVVEPGAAAVLGCALP
jgi:hypothetical protein